MYRIMRLSGIVCLGLALGLVATAARADDPPPNEKKHDGGKPDRGRHGPRPGDPDAMLTRLTKALDLTPEQVTTVKGILEKHKADMPEQRGGDPSELEKFKQLREKMTAAAKAGDKAAEEKLREEMRMLAEGNRQAAEKARHALHAEIAAVLNPEQKKKFEEVANKLVGGRAEKPRMDPGTLHRAVEHLKLSPEQKAKVDALFDQFKKSMSSAPPSDEHARQEIVQKLRADVMKELTEDQIKDLQKMSQSGDRRQARGGKNRPGKKGDDNKDKGEDTGG